MKLLDRYVVRTYVVVFLMSMVVFSIAIVTLDFFARLSSFTDGRTIEGEFAEGYSRFEIIFYFYVAYLPYILKEMLSFISVAAGMFTVTYMLRNNEVQPVLAAGISARRLFLPVFICGFLVSMGHIAFQELVVPSLNREHIALKRQLAGDKRPEVLNVPHLRDGHGTVARAGSYSFADQSLTDVVIARPWTEIGFETWFIDRLEPDGDKWRAATPVHVQPAGIGTVGIRLEPGVAVDFGVSPADVEALASEHGIAELSLRQLKRLADKFPDRRNLQVAVHRQIARPLASFVLLLLGIPLLLTVGRSLMAGAVVAFSVSASFYVLDIFLTSVGNRGDLSPVLAVWLPVALFFSAGISRIATMRT